MSRMGTTDPRSREFETKLDTLINDYADVLGPPGDGMTMLSGAVLVMSWLEPEVDESRSFISTRTTPQTTEMEGLGLVSWASRVWPGDLDDE